MLGHQAGLLLSAVFLVSLSIFFFLNFIFNF